MFPAAIDPTASQPIPTVTSVPSLNLPNVHNVYAHPDVQVLFAMRFYTSKLSDGHGLTALSGACGQYCAPFCYCQAVRYRVGVNFSSDYSLQCLL